MSKHTPGPWKLSGANTVHSDEAKCIVAFVGTANEEVREFSGARQRADARLIAAAPDLLEALEGLRLDDWMTYEGNLEASGYASVDALKFARAAIRKAKGVT